MNYQIIKRELSDNQSHWNGTQDKSEFILGTIGLVCRLMHFTCCRMQWCDRLMLLAAKKLTA